MRLENLIYTQRNLHLLFVYIRYYYYTLRLINFDAIGNDMKKILLGTAAFLALSFPGIAHADLKAVTSELPPYTISADADLPGIGHELVQEISKRSGVAINIEYMPWKRAQSQAQETPNTLVFGLTRTAAREPNYMWVTLLVESSDVFVTTSESVDSYEAAKALSTIAVMGGTPREKSLAKNDITNVEIVPKEELGARMLDGGRVDSWYTLDHRASYIWKQEGNDLSGLVLGKPVKTQEIWLAANKEMPDEDIEKIRAAMEDIRSDGTYDAIFKKYVGG